MTKELHVTAAGAYEHVLNDLAPVFEREAKLIAAALVCGAVFTVGLTGALFGELLAIGARAPSVWMVLPGLCGGIAAIAVVLATRRIARLEPSVVLRRT